MEGLIGIWWLMMAIWAAISVASSGQQGDQKSLVREKVAVADIALAIDQSNSIRDHYRQELDFAKKFVDAFPIGENQTRFALIPFSFANMTRVRLPWSRGVSKRVVLDSLDSMEHDQLGAGTDFARALAVAYEEVCTVAAGDRPDVPNVLVLVTDGFFSSPWERKQSQDAAARLRDAGVLVYAIQVKTDPSLPVGNGPVDDLTLLTANRSRVFAVENFDKLTNELLGRITQQITVEYDDCVYEYLPVTGAACYSNVGGKCVVDAELKIERPARLPHGRPCPSENRTHIDCPRADGCRSLSSSGGSDENTINPLPFNAAKESSAAAASMESGGGNVGIGGTKLPFWAVIVMAAVGGLILLLLIMGIIVSRTPRWRAIFTPAKPRKPQLPGNADDSQSSVSSA